MPALMIVIPLLLSLEEGNKLRDRVRVANLKRYRDWKCRGGQAAVK